MIDNDTGAYEGPRQTTVPIGPRFYLRTANGDGCVANHADTF